MKKSTLALMMMGFVASTATQAAEVGDAANLLI